MMIKSSSSWSLYNLLHRFKSLWQGVGYGPLSLIFDAEIDDASWHYAWPLSASWYRVTLWSHPFNGIYTTVYYNGGPQFKSRSGHLNFCSFHAWLAFALVSMCDVFSPVDGWIYTWPGTSVWNFEARGRHIGWYDFITQRISAQYVCTCLGRTVTGKKSRDYIQTLVHVKHQTPNQPGKPSALFNKLHSNHSNTCPRVSVKLLALSWTSVWHPASQRHRTISK